MYNEKYINDFKETIYKEALNNKNFLVEIANAYIKQYDSPTYEKTLAFKESLDHYVLKQLKENPTFTSTEMYNNYLEYIKYIFLNRKTCGNINLEFNTNIVFSDKNICDKVLSSYPNNAKDKLKVIINQNEKYIQYISQKMYTKEPLSQVELNFIGDYLYTRKDLNSELYRKYVEYLLNDIKKCKNVSNSPQIIASYIAYLPKIFGENCENSRILLTNGLSSKTELILPSELDRIKKKEDLENRKLEDRIIKNLRLYSVGDKYISISKNELNFNLVGDKSLEYSRTLKKENKDLYWIAMVCFHELSHQYQTRKITVTEFNSSGLSILIRNLISADDGVNKADYNNNHDSYEMEIEADEMSWQKMYNFISKFRLAIVNKEEKKEVLEQIKKCKINEKAVYARRTFLTKRQSQDIKSNYFMDDMKLIQENFKKSPKYAQWFNKMRNYYPMLKKLFDTDGNINTDILLNENITSVDTSGIGNNIMGTEVSNYILTKEINPLTKHLLNDDLTEKQVNNLMINIYNSYHLDKMFVSALSSKEVKLEQYDDTNHNFDLNKLSEKYLEKFSNVAHLVYVERLIISIINRRYPNYKVEEFAKPKYSIWNYNDMLGMLCENSINDIDISQIEEILLLYEKSGDQILVQLADNTRKILMNQSKTSGTSGIRK